MLSGSSLSPGGWLRFWSYFYACSESVRAVLSIVAAKGFAVRQMDVVTAFLGSELHEEVYVSPQVGVF